MNNTQFDKFMNDMKFLKEEATLLWLKYKDAKVTKGNMNTVMNTADCMRWIKGV